MRRLLLLVAGLLLLLPACAPERPRREKTRVALLPPTGVRPELLRIAEDGQRHAVVMQAADGEYVVVDGVAGPKFSKCGTPIFAPGSKRVFYWAMERIEGGVAVVLVADGVVVGRGFGGPGRLVFNKDGTRWAAVAGMPERSEGSEKVRGPVVVLADGVELGRYPDAGIPAFSPSGSLAYLVESEGSRITLIVDGQERRVYDPPTSKCAVAIKRNPVGPNLPPQFRVEYLADGSLLVLAQDREGWVMYRDDARVASYPASHGTTGSVAFGFGDPCGNERAFAPSWIGIASAAPVVAWWERLEGSEDRWRVVVDGKPVDEHLCGRFWGGHPPELSPDGRHVMYPCAPLGKTAEGPGSLILDGREFGPYQGIWGQALSQDGQHVTYGGSDGSPERPWSIYVDGRAIAGPFSSVWRPRLDPTAQHVAWQADAGGEQRGVLGVDGRRVASFDDILWGPEFGPDGTASWVIRRGRKVTRLAVPVD